MPKYYTSDEGYLNYLAKRLNVGGVMLRTMETKKIVQIVTTLQSCARVPMLISVNLEAGLNQTCLEDTRVGCHMAVAATAIERFAEKLGLVGYDVTIFESSGGWEGLATSVRDMTHNYDLIIYAANLATKSNQTVDVQNGQNLWGQMYHYICIQYLLCKCLLWKMGHEALNLEGRKDMNLTNIEGIIFDLDGVLIHTDKLHYKAWKAVVDRINVPFDYETNNRLRGVSRM